MYSQRSWVEHTEELQASYSNDELTATKLLLQTLPKIFSFDQFLAICANKASLYGAVLRLLNRRQPADVLADLYRVGVVGNIVPSTNLNRRPMVRWVFRGDSEIILTSQLIIHQALWRELSILG
jgi:hypothetical protein